MTRETPVFLLLLCLFTATAAVAETFPRPPELEADVEFWVSIFTRYDSDEGVLHDSRELGVVYERLDMPAELSRRERQRRVSRHKSDLKRILRSLAAGKRDKLTPEEGRVLALWPADVSNATLAAAVSRIRYQQGLADRFRQGLVRSGRWRSFVVAEFAALGVPVELAALPHVESSYNPDARSHVGASGIWQFTRSTGRRFMQVDHVVDERNDPFAATRAAGRLLAYNYSIAGNWPMAITAYNHGLAGVRRAMRKHGDTAYVDILRNYNGRAFGFASRNFYVAFLAAMQVDLNAERYFPGVVADAAIAYDSVDLPKYIRVTELARTLGVTEAELKKHNPSLQSTIWSGSKLLPQGFGLRMPSASLSRPLADLLAAVPADHWASEQLPDLYHTVARGDTLSQLAATYKTRVSTLVALNNLGSRHRIRAGQRLRLPAAGPVEVRAVAPAVPAVAVAAPAEEAAPEPVEVADATPVAMAVVEEPAEPLQTALLSDPSDYSVAEDSTIEVQPLETLGHFADWLGIRTQRLRDVNGLRFGTPVAVGRRIRLEFAGVDAGEFERRRIEYHRNQQDSFFREHVIVGIVEHKIRRGESIWVLSLRKYKVPVWLFRQYNPALDLHKIRPGMIVKFPQLLASNRS